MSTLTYRGRQVCLGLVGSGGVPALATELRLYTSGSAPRLDGTGFTALPSASGYAPWTLIPGDWTVLEAFDKTTLTLSVKSFTASGASVGPLFGAYVVDAVGPLFWLPLRGQVTVADTATFSLDAVQLFMT